MRVIGTISFLILLLLCVQSHWYVKNKKASLTTIQTALLNNLGDSALAKGEMPVAALVIYDGQVIGEGFNTVRANNNAAGHAEINAINSAMQRMGLDSFMHINRDMLTLISTWEPCYMCQGAIVEYNIQHVVIIKAKSLSHWFGQWRKLERYEWNKQVTESDTIQDNLFKRHPAYEQQKKNL